MIVLANMVDVGPYAYGFNPYAAQGDAGFLGKIVRKATRAVSGAARSVARSPVTRIATGVARKSFLPVMATERAFGAARSLASGGPRAIVPLAIQALPQAQQALKMAGPLGMVASGAAGALVATVRGESLEGIAWAAAEGASPPGIDRAVAAARALREGQPVLNVALSQARQSFVPGSPAQRAFDIGVAAAKGGTRGALNSARQQLRSATEQAAFDAAIGTIGRAAQRVPMRPGTQVDPIGLMSRVRPALQGFQHPNTRLAAAALRRNPALARQSLGDLSRRLNLPARAVASALRDVGLVSDRLKTYVLKSGDIPYKLAQRYTGDQNRWRELPKVNRAGEGAYRGAKDMKVITKNGTTLLDPFYAGLVINVPGDWSGPGLVDQAPTAPAPPVPPSLPAPPPAMPAPPPAVPAPPPALPAPPPPVVAQPPSTPIPGLPTGGTPPVTSPVPGAPSSPIPGLPPAIPPAVPGAPPSTPVPGLPPGTVPAAPAAGEKKGSAAPLLAGLLGAALYLM